MLNLLASEPLEAFKNKLRTGANIAIVCHQNPDGDAIGSTLALGLALSKLGHSVSMIIPNRPPRFLHWLPRFGEMLDHDKDNEQVEAAIMGSDVLCCLDFNAPRRTGALEAAVKKHPFKVLIDHHEEPEDCWDISFSYPKWSSTCELVFDVLEGIGAKETIDADIATCIYTGIMTDTGSFRYSATTPRTHEVAAELLKFGVDPATIHSRVLDSNSEDRIRLWGLALLERLKIEQKGKLALIGLSMTDLHRFHYRPGDTEGLVNQGLSIEKVCMSVYMAEQDGYVKMSARSVGNIPVNEFMRDHFNGGGHRNAAGGRHIGTLKETVSLVKEHAGPFLDQHT